MKKENELRFVASEDFSSQVIVSGTVQDVNTVQNDSGVPGIWFVLHVREKGGYVSHIPCYAYDNVVSAAKANLADGCRINVIGHLSQKASAPEGFFKPSVEVEHFMILPSVKKIKDGHYIKEEPASDLCNVILVGTVDKLFTPGQILGEGHSLEVRACRIGLGNDSEGIECEGNYHFGYDRVLQDFNPVFGERVEVNGRLYEKQWCDSDGNKHSGLFLHPSSIERIQEQKTEKKQESVMERDSGGMEY